MPPQPHAMNAAPPLPLSHTHCQSRKQQVSTTRTALHSPTCPLSRHWRAPRFAPSSNGRPSGPKLAEGPSCDFRGLSEMVVRPPMLRHRAALPRPLAIAVLVVATLVSLATADSGVWNQSCPAPLWHSLSCSNASDKASHGLTPSWCALNNPFITPQPPMQLASTSAANQSVPYVCLNDSDPFSDCTCGARARGVGVGLGLWALHSFFWRAGLGRGHAAVVDTVCGSTHTLCPSHPPCCIVLFGRAGLTGQMGVVGSCGPVSSAKKLARFLPPQCPALPAHMPFSHATCWPIRSHTTAPSHLSASLFSSLYVGLIP